MANPPPPETEEDATGTGSGSGTPPPAPAPSSGGADSGTGSVDADTGTITGGLVLEPFKNWDAELGGPETGQDTFFDMTDPSKITQAGLGSPPGEDKGFTFFRARVEGADKPGIFSLAAGQIASVKLEQVQFVARKSKRYEKQGLHVLEKWVFPAELPPVDPSNPTLLVKPDVDRGGGESRIYKTFYFKRLVLSMHRAPEDGGDPSATGGTPPPTTTGGSSAPAPPVDQLYFLRIMVAGVSAGPGTRTVQAADSDVKKRNEQPIDLLVNLVHLDGLSDRFRRRSLASKWNPISDQGVPN